jgi:hypothetical protein
MNNKYKNINNKNRIVDIKERETVKKKKTSKKE